jgi:hypothetical protein
VRWFERGRTRSASGGGIGQAPPSVRLGH